MFILALFPCWALVTVIEALMCGKGYSLNSRDNIVASYSICKHKSHYLGNCL